MGPPDAVTRLRRLRQRAERAGAGTVAAVPAPGPLGLPDSVRACLFDLDGVLTRTATVHMAAWKRTFDEFLRGHEPRPRRSSASSTTTGTSTASPAPTASATSWPAGGSRCPRARRGDPADAATVQGIATRKNELVLRSSTSTACEVYPGSVRYLRAVKDAGLATAVVTASANGEQVIAAAGFADLIDVRVDGVVAARDGLRGKPAPDTFLAGARAAGRRAGARRSSSRTRCPGSPPAGRGTSATSSGSTGSGTPTSCAAQGADVVVQDLAELLGATA